MTKEEFLRRVFSVDTKAGYNLRYIITKATCCPEYAVHIIFNRGKFRYHTASQVVLWLFTWKYTSQGSWYWDQLFFNLKDILTIH